MVLIRVLPSDERERENHESMIIKIMKCRGVVRSSTRRVHCSISNLERRALAIAILEIAAPTACSMWHTPEETINLQTACELFTNCENFHFVMIKSYLISEVKCY